MSRVASERSASVSQSGVIFYFLFCLSFSTVAFIVVIQPAIRLRQIVAGIVVLVYQAYLSLPKLSEGEVDWDSPFALFLGMNVLYSVGGTLSFELNRILGIHSAQDMPIVSVSILLATIALFSGRCVASFIKVFRRITHSIEPSPKQLFVPKRLQSVLWVYVLIGNLAAMLLYNFYRDVPLFSRNITLSRARLLQYSPGSGSLMILQLLLILVVPLSYYLYRKREIGPIKLFLQAALCFVPLSFYGGRFYIFFPVVLTILVCSTLVEHISLVRAIAWAFALMAAALLFVAFRFSRSGIYFDSALALYLTEMFPELRLFSYVVADVGPLGIYGEIIVDVLSRLAPSVLFSIVGLDKRQLMLGIGGLVARELNSADPIGLRVSLMGESYLAGGYAGIVITYGVIGCFATWMSARMKDLPRGDARRFPITVTMSYLPFAIPYGLSVIPMIVFAAVFSCVVVRLSATSK